MAEICNQSGCGKPADFLFYWPGRPESGICSEHEPMVRGVALAVGFNIEFTPVEPASNETDSLRVELAAARADKAAAVVSAYLDGWGDGYATGCGTSDDGGRLTPFVSAADAWAVSDARKALEVRDE